MSFFFPHMHSLNVNKRDILETGLKM